MNGSQKTSYIQIAFILGAMAAGALMTQIVPDRVPLAAYVPHTQTIPTTAVFKHASAKKASHDSSRDLTGIDVDVRRLAMLGRVS
jgi:hypothetical protein